MARRYDHSREDLKKMAINVGKEILSDEGLGKLSTRRITKEIGYTVGTFYQLFDNLDDYILHLNHQTLKEIMHEIEGKIDKNHSIESIRIIAEIYLKYSEDNYNKWSALFEHQAEGELPEWYNKVLFEIFKIIEKCLEGLVKTVRGRKNAARVLWAGLHGIAILGATGKLDTVNSVNSRALAENFLNNYLKGIVYELA